MTNIYYLKGTNKADTNKHFLLSSSQLYEVVLPLIYKWRNWEIWD